MPCAGSDKENVGESAQSLTRRLGEYKKDFIFHKSSRAREAHIDKTWHRRDWDKATDVAKGIETHMIREKH